jgi:hypothetical protein
MLTHEQTKAVEIALGAEKAAPLIDILQGIVTRIDNQKVAVKADLLLELATKADIAVLAGEIARLEGKIDSNIARLEGKIDSNIARLEGKLESEIARLEGKLDTSVAKINGELQSIRLWMKLLVAVGIIGMTFFSPTTVKLLEMLK